MSRFGRFVVALYGVLTVVLVVADAVTEKGSAATAPWQEAVLPLALSFMTMLFLAGWYMPMPIMLVYADREARRTTTAPRSTQVLGFCCRSIATMVMAVPFIIAIDERTLASLGYVNASVMMAVQIYSLIICPIVVAILVLPSFLSGRAASRTREGAPLTSQARNLRENSVSKAVAELPHVEKCTTNR